MIRGLPSITNAMVALAHAPFEFHLTGSRFLGYENPKSDWDFFVQVPERGIGELRSWLISSGFRSETDTRYVVSLHGEPHSAQEVWIHSAANIHIQVVRDAATKAEVQNILKTMPDIALTFRRLDKDQRSAVWKIAHMVFESAKKHTNQPAASKLTGSR